LYDKREGKRISALPIIREITSGGFTYQNGADGTFIEWKSINRIIGYKVDLYTIDEIRLSIEVENDSFIISEGWMDLFDGLNIYLQLKTPDWLLQVGENPFEEVEIVCYEKGK
jgi:hypothetical protein